MSQLLLRLEGLSTNMTKAHLEELLEPVRDGISEIIMPRPTMWMQFPINRAEVAFHRESEAIQAYARLQGAIVDGCKLSLSFVREVLRRPRESPTRRRSRSRHRDRRDASPPSRKRDRSRDRSYRRSRSRNARRRSRSRSVSSRRSSSGSPEWNGN